jgi:hypothetical protein
MRVTPARTKAMRVLALGAREGHHVSVSHATADPTCNPRVTRLTVSVPTARRLVDDGLAVNDGGGRLTLTDQGTGFVRRWLTEPEACTSCEGTAVPPRHEACCPVAAAAVAGAA